MAENVGLQVRLPELCLRDIKPQFQNGGDMLYLTEFFSRLHENILVGFMSYVLQICWLILSLLQFLMRWFM